MKDLPMANFSELNTTISDLFGVIGTLITEFVDLLTGDLIILAVVGAVIGLVVGLIVLLMGYIRKIFSNSVPSAKMKWAWPWVMKVVFRH